jgi:hypothetical protein
MGGERRRAFPAGLVERKRSARGKGFQASSRVEQFAV